MKPYDWRYGKCVGIAKVDGGWAMFMEDGSKHYIGNTLQWLAEFFSTAFFILYITLRRTL